VAVIYEICTPQEARGKGIGRAIIERIPLPIELKCPLDNESNHFYQHIGFRKVRVDPGKKRQLNVWRLDNEQTAHIGGPKPLAAAVVATSKRSRTPATIPPSVPRNAWGLVLGGQP
jgi:hypothetical protein